MLFFQRGDDGGEDGGIRRDRPHQDQTAADRGESGSAKRRSPGLVNFVTALAYHFCLALPAAFTQPGDHLLAEPCRLRRPLSPRPPSPSLSVLVSHMWRFSRRRGALQIRSHVFPTSFFTRERGAKRTGRGVRPDPLFFALKISSP